MLKNFPLPVLFAGILAQTAWVQHDPFFWDTIQLASKHAHFYYNNQLQFSLLPADIDSGHPPLLGYYLAVIWTVFGKTLAASHWAMTPFLLLNVYLLYRIGHWSSGSRWAWAFPLLVLFDPVVAGQSIMVSPDILLLTGFLCALLGILRQQRIWVLAGILLLCTVSLRGMMSAAALGLWVVSTGKLRWSLPAFLPGGAAAALFLWWHWSETGWVGFHTNSPWAPAFQRVDATGFLRNLLILGWRWLDFGRMLEWAVWIYLIWKSAGFRTYLKTHRELLLLGCWLLLLLTPSALLYQNLSAHRYFIPAFVAFHLLVFQGISRAEWPDTQKKILLALLLTGMLSGNTWVYPRGISMDWDSTLAHRPYHGLRAEMLDYLDAHNIAFDRVGTAFPNLNPGELVSLNNDIRNFSEIDFSKNEYILASNIFNDISGLDYERLETTWNLRKTSSRFGVWMRLYEKKYPEKSILHHQHTLE